MVTQSPCLTIIGHLSRALLGDSGIQLRCLRRLVGSRGSSEPPFLGPNRPFELGKGTRRPRARLGTRPISCHAVDSRIFRLVRGELENDQLFVWLDRVPAGQHARMSESPLLVTRGADRGTRGPARSPNAAQAA